MLANAALNCENIKSNAMHAASKIWKKHVHKEKEKVINDKPFIQFTVLKALNDEMVNYKQTVLFITIAWYISKDTDTSVQNL